MARTRADLAPDIKRETLVNTAAELFTEVGFDETSMAALARAAGVAPNTIYWYFESKDALLIAVLEHLIATGGDPDGHTAPPETLVDELMTVVTAVLRADRLIGPLHVRANASPLVASWHDNFHAGADRWLRSRARRHLRSIRGGDVSDEALATIPRIWTFAIEGMVSHRLPETERRAICETLVRQLEAID